MREIDLFRLDLNLLKIFVAMYEEGSVTAAGDRLGLAQSSMSHALSRLRSAFDDALFIRSTAGMLPTPYAESLVEPIRQAMADFQAALDRGRAFDPESSDRTFTLIMTDLGELAFLPRLMSHISQHAPRINVAVLQMTRSLYREALESGKADIAVGLLPPGYADFFQQPLFEESFSCFLRADHPLREGLTLETFLEAEHLVVGAPLLGDQHVRKALGVKASKRRVRLQVQRYVIPPALLSETSMVAVLPTALEKYYSVPGPIISLPCPFPIETMVMRQFWHGRSNRDSGCRWLRQTIAKLFRRLPSPRTDAAALRADMVRAPDTEGARVEGEKAASR